MPHVRASAVRTPYGDATATFAALLAGHGAHRPLSADPLQDLVAMASPLIADAAPDLVLLATTKGDLDRWCADLRREHPTGDGGPAWCAERLRAAFGCPALTVSAACASGTMALGIAANRIGSGAVRRVLVLGCERPTGFITDGFTALRAIDPLGCRPFHADRNGLVPGEALAAILLDREGDGPWLSGWGAHMDANHLTGPDRQGAGLAVTCRAALACAGLEAPGVVIAHGTGTRFNDDAESLAYASVCPHTPVTAFKGLLSHSLGVCGLADAVLAVMAIGRGQIPGVVGTATPGCAGAITLLPPGVHPLPAGGVLIANAGFGGLNGAVVIGSGPPNQRPAVAARCQARIELDALGWTGATPGRWQEAGTPGSLPRLGAVDAIGRIDAHWGRLDLSCRAAVAIATRGPTLPTEAAIVLLTDRGCAASDRAFDASRSSGTPDPQRFTYTLPSTPVGEASIRLRLRGPGLSLLGASDDDGRAIARDLLAGGAPAVLLLRIEADRPPHVAWGEWWMPA